LMYGHDSELEEWQVSEAIEEAIMKAALGKDWLDKFRLAFYL